MQRLWQKTTIMTEGTLMVIVVPFISSTFLATPWVSFIHPSIFIAAFSSTHGHRQLCQLPWGEGKVAPWTNCQFHARVTSKEKQLFKLIHTYGQFRVPNSPHVHIFRLDGSPSPQRESQRHWENIQTPHIKSPATFSCEASELITQLLRLPLDYLLAHLWGFLVYINTFGGLTGYRAKSKWNFYCLKLLQLLRSGSMQRVPVRRELISPGLMWNSPPPCLPPSQSILPLFAQRHRFPSCNERWSPCSFQEVRRLKRTTPSPRPEWSGLCICCRSQMVKPTNINSTRQPCWRQKPGAQSRLSLRQGLPNLN